MSEFRNFENHSNGQFYFCWVIALRAEATPLIEAFNMKNVGNKSLFPIYTNEDTGHALVVSGIGPLKNPAIPKLIQAEWSLIFNWFFKNVAAAADFTGPIPDITRACPVSSLV